MSDKTVMDRHCVCMPNYDCPAWEIYYYKVISGIQSAAVRTNATLARLAMFTTMGPVEVMSFTIDEFHKLDVWCAHLTHVYNTGRRARSNEITRLLQSTDLS